MANIFRPVPAPSRKEWPRQSAVIVVGTSLLLTLLAPMPVGAQSTASAPQLNRSLGDTSCGTAAVLRATPAPVCARPMASAPQLRPVLADTSQGTSRPLIDGDTLRAMYDSAFYDPAIYDTGSPPVFAPTVPGLFLGPQRAIYLPADATRGTPKALYLDAVAPVGRSVGAVATPEPRRSVVDTTQDSPLTTLPASAIPIGQATGLVSTPEPKRSVVDTTQDTALVLLAAAVPPPIVVPVHYGPVRYAWFYGDTTRGTAKALTFDAQAPVGAATGLVGTPEPKRSVVNTSAGSPTGLTLAPIPPAPFVPPCSVATPRYGWVNPDGSRSTPKPLVADAQAPVANVGSNAPQLRWVGLETSFGTPASLAVVAQAPFANPFSPQVQRRFVAASATAGTPKTLSADAVAPLVNVPVFLPDDVRTRWIVDTTQGRVGESLPVWNAPQPVLDRLRWLPADTSHSLSTVVLPQFRFGNGAGWIFTVAAQDRKYTIALQARTFTIGDQAMTYTVSPSDRKYTVAAQARTYTVAAPSRTYTVI